MPGAPREVHHSLPAVERMEYHRKAAKDLLRAARAGHADAVGRLREAIGQVPGELRLADAQRAIAREHGHSSWAAFRRDIERQSSEPERSVARIGPVAPERFEERAAALLRELDSGDARARRRLRAHVPRLAELNDITLGERATIADARLVIAREYGFPTWSGTRRGTPRRIRGVASSTPAARARCGRAGRDPRRGRSAPQAPARLRPRVGAHQGRRRRLAAR